MKEDQFVFISASSEKMEERMNEKLSQQVKCEWKFRRRTEKMLTSVISTAPNLNLCFKTKPSFCTTRIILMKKSINFLVPGYLG